MVRLRRLTLTQFRSYAALTWRPAARISVLHGPNGSGKTNLLEAVSLLAPGRGLRGARNADLPNRTGPGTWAVAGRYTLPEGREAQIGTGLIDATSDRRVFRLDGVAPRSQADIARVAAAVWLTPQMDRLFQEGMSARRRFLDRLVWALEPAHAREMAAHDTAIGSRNRLLQEGRLDPAWLAGLEDAVARHAVAATASRLALVDRLNARILGGALGAFPPSRMELACPIAQRLREQPALAVEDWLRQVLHDDRSRDAAAGATAIGAHRTDLQLTDLTTGTPAALASTGQQKALLIGIVLAHAGLIAEVRGAAPLLLMDEPAVHLDAARREALWALLLALPAQVMLTGVDGETFLPLAGQAEAYVTGGGILRPDTRFICTESDTGTVTGTA